MTKRQAATPAPAPLEDYAGACADLFERRNARARFRRYREGLRLPAERHKTLTALANAEPIDGIHAPPVQALPWFLSESTWDAATRNGQRLALLRRHPATAPDEAGVLVLDETGDRKGGPKTAQVGRQSLGRSGPLASGVVTVSSRWAAARVSWPLVVAPFTPKQHFGNGMSDPAYRTKPQIAGELVRLAVADALPFRAVVADSFYGENETFGPGLVHLGLGSVLALRPCHAWWARAEQVNARTQAARPATWDGPDAPGDWQPGERALRDRHRERWWARAVMTGPYGPQRRPRAVVAPTAPTVLAAHTTWYLVTNLPAPTARRTAADGVGEQSPAHQMPPDHCA